MKSLWFLIPAHGRLDMTRVCLRQLARTCATLNARGLNASAVVIADDENLDTARELGFGTIEAPNQPLGRKWNDGYELAGREGVDYVVPLGTDDWVDAELILTRLPRANEIRCHRLSAVVSEDGRRLARLRIPYDGGDGVRTFKTEMFRPLRYRPADDDRQRAIDTSIWTRLKARLDKRPRLFYADLHPLQIVDWKSHGEQLNSFRGCQTYQEQETIRPWAALAEHYPEAALDEMRALYRGVPRDPDDGAAARIADIQRKTLERLGLERAAA